jgi:4-amino-4-deoxy-L-arabinose transferase-like glycosyltransferase
MDYIVMKNEHGHKSIRMLLLAALTAGILLRWLYISSLPNSVIWSDEREYLRLGHTLSQGEGFVTPEGHPTADRAPGYPFGIALLAFLHLNSALAVRLVQVLLSAGCSLIVYGIARHVGDDRSAMTALWLASLYPYFIYLAGAVLPTALFSFLLLAAVFVLVISERQRRKTWLFISGALFGLAVLTVPTAAVLVLVALLWLGFVQRAALMRMALFLAGCLLVIGPWMMRNYYALGVWQVSTSGGYNFWLGNNPETQINYPGNIPTPEEMQRKLNTLMDEKERSRYYQQEALRYIGQQPGAAILRTLTKAGYFWRLDPSPATQSYVAQSRSVRWLGTICFSSLLLLAIIGGWTMLDVSKRVLLLWLLFAGAFTLVHALTIVKVRFRLPLDNFVLIAAAVGLVRTGEHALAWMQRLKLKTWWNPNPLDFGSEADWSQLSIERKGIV